MDVLKVLARIAKIVIKDLLRLVLYVFNKGGQNYSEYDGFQGHNDRMEKLRRRSMLDRHK